MLIKEGSSQDFVQRICMSRNLETFFGQRAIAENAKYFRRRFFENNGLDYTFPPRTIDIHLGYKGGPCSLKCIWCFDQDEQANKPKKWTPERIQQFAQEIAKVINWEKDGFRVEEVYLAGGGEPSLYPEVANMVVKKFSSAGRNVWLTTNGVNIQEPLFSTLIAKARGILISVPGTDPQSYLENGGFNYFEKVLGTIKQVLAARASQSSLLEVDVTHVLMPNTIRHLEEFILLLNAMGVDEFRIRYDIFSDPQAEQNVRGIETVRTILLNHPDLRIKVVLKSPQEEALSEEMSCFSPFLWPTWNPLHGVFPCAHATDEHNRMSSKQNNGVYSLVDMQSSLDKTLHPKCHRRCPSRIHWFNLYVNELLKIQQHV